MAKMTLSGLKSAMATYVAASKQAGEWDDSQTSFIGLLDKIGKTYTIDGGFEDKLPELDGEELPFGKTIEEYFIDLTLPSGYANITTEGAKDVVPALPAVEDVCYSYSLGRDKIKTTVPFDDFERATRNAEEAGNISAKIVERLTNSYDMVKFAVKKQLLGNVMDKAVTAGSYVQLAAPVDDEKGEAFIQKIQELVEDASFANEGNSLSGALIGSAPSLILYVKKGTIPAMKVKTLAGAFNKEDLALGCEIKVVDDFGTMTNQKSCYALLVDPRGVKVHNGYNAIRKGENADGDFVNLVKHYELTCFASNYVFVKAIGTVSAS